MLRTRSPSRSAPALHISVIMASPCATDDDAPSPSHGWCVVRGACCVPRETRQNRSTPTRVSRETLRSVYGCNCVSRETTSPRRKVLASCVGSRRIAAEHRLGGVGTSLFTCSSSGGGALCRSASTSAGAALRAIGGPPARVSREASTPAVLSGRSGLRVHERLRTAVEGRELRHGQQL